MYDLSSYPQDPILGPHPWQLGRAPFHSDPFQSYGRPALRSSGVAAGANEEPQRQVSSRASRRSVGVIGYTPDYANQVLNGTFTSGENENKKTIDCITAITDGTDEGWGG